MNFKGAVCELIGFIFESHNSRLLRTPRHPHVDEEPLVFLTWKKIIQR